MAVIKEIKDKEVIVELKSGKSRSYPVECLPAEAFAGDTVKIHHDEDGTVHMELVDTDEEAPVRKTKKTATLKPAVLGIASLVMGVLALVFSFIPSLVLTILAGLCGLGFGIAAILKKKRDIPVIAGIVLAVLAIVIALFIKHAPAESTSSASTPDASETEVSANIPVDYVKLIVDDENAAAAVTKFGKDGGGYAVNFYVQNKTDSPVVFTTEESSINGYLLEPEFEVTIPAGESVTPVLTFDETSLTDNNITEIDNIELNLHIYNADDPSTDYYNDYIILEP